ncbi:MAG: efflux RND transporter periplasmic adaptor subunit, partial [Vicinamibacteria bacterium]
TRIVGIVVGALVVAAIVGFSVTKDQRNRVVVQTQKAARADLLSTVTASGEVKPKRFVNISANVSGRITHLYVVEGETVPKGKVLARIDSTRYEAGTRQSEAAMQAARSELDRAQADMEVTKLAYERSRQMHAEKLISDQAYDQAQAELKMKEAQVASQRRRIAQTEAVLDSDQDDLSKTTVVAPMDGIVTSLTKEEGEVVIGAQSFSPTVIMTVADLSVMEAELLVDETDIRNVKLGQEAKIRVDALEGVEIMGEVTEIGSSAIARGAGQTTTTTTANQAKDFKVVVTLKNPPSTLRPGLNATADITTDRKAKVLAVPIQAVVVRQIDADGKVVDPAQPGAPGEQQEGGPPRPQKKLEEKEGVFVVTSGQAYFKPVKTGIMGETDIEIATGVAEGDELVTGSYKTLRTLKNEARIKLEEKDKKGAGK